jgi:hypothetical protein
MKLALMQPYFLPYIGYFQLINAVDTFIYYDDVNYIKQGWINRNRIIINGKENLFTLDLNGASSFKHINDIKIGNNRKKLLKTFRLAYKKAPFFNEIEPLLYCIFNSEETNLSRYIIESNREILTYLGINTKVLLSSEIDKDKSLKGQEKVISICKKCGATEYVNSIGGEELYSKEEFRKANISLLFLKSQKTEYRQLLPMFIPWLSIVDILMFNSTVEVQQMLRNYDLI